MNKFFIIAFIILFTSAVGSIAIYLYRFSELKPRHIHAGFIVFEDGKQQDFASIKYMSLMPCNIETREFTDEEIQDQKAHLHEDVGYTAHSHRTGARWKDLFKNIGFEINPSKELTGYINDQKVSNILNEYIYEYDSAVFFIGDVDTNLLSNAIIKEQIIAVENNSQDCGASNP